MMATSVGVAAKRARTQGSNGRARRSGSGLRVFGEELAVDDDAAAVFVFVTLVGCLIGDIPDFAAGQ